MNILICGVGAIGSNLTARLVADLRGEHVITVLDCDVVEKRNVQPGTQLYTYDQIGHPKVEALQFNMYKWYQRKIKIIDDDITVLNALPAYDFIIDCFDNYHARERLQGMFDVGRYIKLEDGLPYDLLHIGFSDRFTFAIEWADNSSVPTDITSGFDICEMEGASAFVNLTASYGALVSEDFIINKKKIDLIGNRYSVNVIG